LDRSPPPVAGVESGPRRGDAAAGVLAVPVGVGADQVPVERAEPVVGVAVDGRHPLTIDQHGRLGHQGRPAAAIGGMVARSSSTVHFPGLRTKYEPDSCSGCGKKQTSPPVTYTNRPVMSSAASVPRNATNGAM